MNYDAHNQEVREVWQSFKDGNPIRIPIILGVSDRYYVLCKETNPRGITFAEYSQNPDAMFHLQCGFEPHYRKVIPGDHEMGLPENGWNVNIDFQNYYEAAWLGATVVYPADQVPYTLPLLTKGKENLLLDRGLPDPFDGFMSTARTFRERFLALAKNKLIEGRPITHIGLPFMWTDGPFTLGCELRGAAQLCMDMIESPAYVHQLMEYITEATIIRFKAWREYIGEPEKSDSFGFADDSIQMLSTDMYREFVLPYHQRLSSALSTEKQPGFCHLCGNAERFFPIIQEKLHIGTFDTGFPINHVRVIQSLAKDTIIQGGIPADLLLHGTQDTIRQNVRELITAIKPHTKSFVFREGNDTPPGTPIENMWAFYLAGKEFGRYDGGYTQHDDIKAASGSSSLS